MGTTNIHKNNLSEVSPRRKDEIIALFQADDQRLGGPLSLQEIIRHYKNKIGPESDFGRVNKRKALSTSGTRKGNLAPRRNGAFLDNKAR